LAQVKEGKEEKSPHAPQKEKDQETNNKNPTRARARDRFVKPTVEEVAAHVRAKGYTFDAEQFWHYYDSNGWMVGSHVMKSWQSACVTWQKKEEREAAVEAARQAHIDAKMDERAAKRLETVRPLTVYERKRAEFELEDEACEARRRAAEDARRAAAAAKPEAWALCAERCANFRDGRCTCGAKIPPQLRAHQCPPEECPYFALRATEGRPSFAKKGLSAVVGEGNASVLSVNSLHAHSSLIVDMYL
jgi:hypothetical protein